MRYFYSIIIILILFSCNKANIKITSNENENLPQQRYYFAGKIESSNKVDLTSKLSAKIIKINGDIGSFVKKDEPIIIFDVKEVGAQYESAKKNYDNAKINLERNLTLYESGNISKQQKETAEYQFSQAESNYIQLQVQFGNGVISSPINGYIVSKNINTGETSTPGVPLLTIVNLDNLYISAFIPENLLYQFHSGMPVIIKFSEIPDKTFKGEISVIDPVVDSKSKTSIAKVKILDKEKNLKPGMFALIGIEK
jgi:HlyD family secretion protein